MARAPWPLLGASNLGTRRGAAARGRERVLGATGQVQGGLGGAGRRSPSRPAGRSAEGRLGAEELLPLDPVRDPVRGDRATCRAQARRSSGSSAGHRASLPVGGPFPGREPIGELIPPGFQPSGHADLAIPPLAGCLGWEVSMSAPAEDRPPSHRRGGRSPRQFRENAAVLVIDQHRTVAEVAHGLGVVELTLGDSVRQERIDRGEKEGTTTEGWEEEARLRREVKRLTMERGLRSEGWLSG